MPEGVARGSSCSPAYSFIQSLANICLKIALTSNFSKVEFVVILPIYAQIVKEKGHQKVMSRQAYGCIAPRDN